MRLLESNSTEAVTQTTELEKEKKLMGNKIQELFDEVEIYKQAIQDAKDALASAEEELDETLDAEYNKQQ